MLTFRQYPWQAALDDRSHEPSKLETGVGALVLLHEAQEGALKLPQSPGLPGVYELQDEIAGKSRPPRRRSGHDLFAREGAYGSSAEGSHFGKYLSRLLEFIYRLQTILLRRGVLHGTWRVSWKVVWEELTGTEVALQQENLIDKLAKERWGDLDSIYRKPRRELRRRSASLPIHKIREVDARTVRKIARLPGSTLAEKLGDKRVLPAVERYETVDVLENRVVEHFCRLVGEQERVLQKEAKRRGRGRVVKPQTRKFTGLCRAIRTTPPFSTVRKLTTPRYKPTYALEQSKDYGSIWIAYQELLRHMSDRDKCWHWTRRSFLNWALVVLAEIYHKAFSSAPMISASRWAFEKHMRVGADDDFGLWLNTSSLPGPKLLSLQNGGECTVSLLTGTDLQAFKNFPNLTWLNADAYLVASQRGGSLRVCPVYALFGNQRPNGGGALRRAMRSLREDMRTMRRRAEEEAGVELRKVVLLWPEFTADDPMEEGGDILPVPVGVGEGVEPRSERYAERLRQVLLG